jgi:hypothetical protein
MVNARTPCDHDRTVKRLLAVAFLAIPLAACSGESGREFARYYDPEGYFATNLPAANDLAVMPAQAAPEGPSILSGVVATPPQPSPSPAGGGLVDIGATQDLDQTTYRAIVVTTDSFQTLDDMALFFLTADPIVDVTLDEPLRIDGHEARLIVADVTQDGATTASVAAAITLGPSETGFLVIAVFPPGGWESERGDFLRVLESFRTTLPPGMEQFPMAQPVA